jgi:NAD(P)-dependent dehydrogenase (short-subunit alcohol dehydrogenase family)
MALPEGLLAPKTLDGSVAFVTGGGTGLGKAISVELARAGAVVAIASRNPDHRLAGVAAVEAVGGQAVSVELDVRSPEQVRDAFETAERLAGSVNLLINNAAANFYAPAEEITPNGWAAVVDRVLNGGFYCATEFARRLIPSGRGGSIVNIAASTGWNGGPGVAHSGAAKAGILNLTRSLAVEWAPDQIRVNAVVPGLFKHDDDDPLISAGRRWHGDVERSVPMGRGGRLEEIGWLVSYLCSPYAAFITGQWIAIDGGGRLAQTMTRGDFVPIRDQLKPREPAQ